MRITRLLNLTFLAPDTQEEILSMETTGGREPLAERDLREVVRHNIWAQQRQAWLALLDAAASRAPLGYIRQGPTVSD